MKKLIILVVLLCLFITCATDYSEASSKKDSMSNTSWYVIDLDVVQYRNRGIACGFSETYTYNILREMVLIGIFSIK